MGDELGSATYIDRLLVVFRTIYTNFHLNREHDFLAIVQILGQKCRQKMLIFSFLGYLDENESDLHMHYCATASASNFQVLVFSG